MNIKIIDETFYGKEKWLYILTFFGLCSFFSRWFPYIYVFLGWFFVILGLYGFQKFYFESKNKKRKKK